MSFFYFCKMRLGFFLGLFITLSDAGEAGTHNVPGICGLAEGLRYVRRRGPEKILRHEQALLRRMRERLGDTPSLRLFDGPGQTGVLSLLVSGRDCEAAAARLSEQGVAVRAGLHCAPLAHESAGTLETGTVRLSFSDFNTEEEIDRAAVLLRRL